MPKMGAVSYTGTSRFKITTSAANAKDGNGMLYINQQVFDNGNLTYEKMTDFSSKYDSSYDDVYVIKNGGSVIGFTNASELNIEDSAADVLDTAAESASATVPAESIMVDDVDNSNATELEQATEQVSEDLADTNNLSAMEDLEVTDENVAEVVEETTPEETETTADVTEIIEDTPAVEEEEVPVQEEAETPVIEEEISQVEEVKPEETLTEEVADTPEVTPVPSASVIAEAGEVRSSFDGIDIYSWGYNGHSQVGDIGRTAIPYTEEDIELMAKAVQHEADILQGRDGAVAVAEEVYNRVLAPDPYYKDTVQGVLNQGYASLDSIRSWPAASEEVKQMCRNVLEGREWIFNNPRVLSHASHAGTDVYQHQQGVKGSEAFTAFYYPNIKRTQTFFTS